MDELTEELLRLNKRLIDSITKANWLAYSELCDPTLTAFEPESVGHLVEAMAFHRYYFDLQRSEANANITMASPNVRVMGDVAVVSYVRLDQSCDAGELPVTTAYAETRIWQNQEGRWKHVHFHRSRAS